MVIAEGETGWSLLQAARWADAREAFEIALTEEQSAENYMGLAEAWWWAGNVQTSIDNYERAYTAARQHGDTLAATRAALSLALNYKCCLGNDAAARGWLERAETAAGTGDPAAVQGWLWSMRSYLTADHDVQAALGYARKAIDYAALTGDRDLELLSRADNGVLLTRIGRVEEGMRLVDEAMAGISAGENSRLDTAVFVCCIMLMACETTSDLARAQQWLQVADRYWDKYGCRFMYSECRALYGGILLAVGRWAEAEHELESAMALTRDSFQFVYVIAAGYLADLRLRQGNIEVAEALLGGIDQELTAVLPLATLKLARGQHAMAQALLERTLRNFDSDSIISVRALALLAEVHLAAGDLAAAAAAVAKLNAAAARSSWSEASARAAMAAGCLAAAHSDTGAALGYLEHAMLGFAGLGFPLESARARLAIADLSKDTNRELAIAEAQGAHDAFEDLGAHADVDAAAALLRLLGVPTRPGPKRLGLLSQREQEVLRLLSSGLSNPEIAERLVISRKTASHHVSSVLAKLSLRNRAEAVAFAARTSRS